MGVSMASGWLIPDLIKHSYGELHTCSVSSNMYLRLNKLPNVFMGTVFWLSHGQSLYNSVWGVLCLPYSVYVELTSIRIGSLPLFANICVAHFYLNSLEPLPTLVI
jgi:hypothetical protein